MICDRPKYVGLIAVTYMAFAQDQGRCLVKVLGCVGGGVNETNSGRDQARGLACVTGIQSDALVWLPGSQ